MSQAADQYSQLRVSRPYRSHKIRACDACRKRKARCDVASIGDNCQLCREQGKTCSYSVEQKQSRPRRLPPSDPSLGERQNNTSGLKRSHRLIDDSGSLHTPDPGTQSWDASRVPTDGQANEDRRGSDKGRQSLHIVGPAVSSDAHVLEQYMSPGLSQGRISDNPYSVYFSDPSKPILYKKVPRGRVGLSINDNAGVKQREIFEQILYPNASQIRELYLAKIHPAFPILDENLLRDSSANQSRGSAALLCDVYASSLVYWNQAPISAGRSRPDQRYAWNLAVQALADDFLGPDLATLQAAVVELNGRPVYSIIGNVVNNGRAVALSYSLGVNRNPSQWSIPPIEKALRIRLWWGVLIHDRWGSFAHGTPSNISSKHYDVPIPSLKMLLPNSSVSVEHRRSSESFIALCHLSEILGQALPLVYDLEGQNQKDTSKIIRRIEADLDEWEDTLPNYLSYDSHQAAVSGSSSLRLCFLSLKMLICRISLHAISQQGSTEALEAYRFRQVESRHSAQAIVDFITSLKTSQLAEFWLPYTAYYLTSTITLLLRFAVETTEDSVAETCVSSVKMFTSWLRHAREVDDWDLAEDCLNNCEGIITRMTDNGQRPRQKAVPEAPPVDFFEAEPPSDWLDATLPVSYGPMDGSGQIRDLWDMFGFDEQFPV
ncbi:C6 transcription factor [Rhexocercosporidium sp. MPI-PUGE-AT-0058]|nr:C6 transcription factor [Rhexocercosporidium sp. MPI-PUGE-AT-0058]